MIAVLAFAAFATAYRLIVFHGLGRSGLMFVGLPTLLAVILALAPPARTTIGGIVKGITLVLLVLAPLLGEGFLCILIASPIFYFVGILVGGLSDALDRRRRASRGARLSCAAVLMLPMCLEGALPIWTVPREQDVSAQRVIDAPQDTVREALAGSMRIDALLPGLLRIGFPRPIRAWGSGLQVGDERGLHFTGAEGTPPGDLLMRVVESRPGFVRTEVVGDRSKVAEWLRWQSVDVTWRPVDATHTQVICHVRYLRGLDPAWYFGPWERFAVRQAANYFITANATPDRAR